MIRLLLIFISCQISANTFCQNNDLKILEKINVHRNRNYDNFFKTVTNADVYVNFGTAIAVTAVGYINNNKITKQQGYNLFTTQITTALATQILKKIIKRNRPFITYSQIQPYKIETGFSMPSGHTSSIFATATTIALLSKKWYYITPAFAYAGLVGYSRMHLGVHYPTDVLAGATLGVGSAIATRWLGKKIWK